MIEPLISVILPIYNVEPYLCQCVDSVRRQTYKNIEIILVDDGSTDSSPHICDEYAGKDPRIKVYHKQNGGLSDARNFGTDKALGKYFTYVDSDDYIDDDYVEYLYKLLIKYNCSMSICQHRVKFHDGRVQELGKTGDELMTARDCLQHMLYQNGVDTSAWAKLYSASLWNGIKYPLGKLFEDIGTTYRFLIKAGEIAVGNESKYNYIMRSSSIINQKFSVKKMDLLEMTDKMAEDVCKEYPDLESAVERRQVYARFSTLNQMSNTKNYQKEKRELIKYIQSHAKNVLRDPLAPARDKIAIRFLHVGYSFYKTAWKLYEKINK